MNTVFADTHYCLALLNPDDVAHLRAVEWTRSFRGRMITTRWVLMELADGMCRSPDRPAVVSFLRAIERDPSVNVVLFSEKLFNEALSLYAARQDKTWSLTVCTSFVVMEQQRIREAATGDRHFEQAGFSALLR